MKDVEYVKSLLMTDYDTHYENENPYPDLQQLIAVTEFDFESGDVLDQRDNGEPNRDGIHYQFFPAHEKRILVHRFIVAVALGKWPPRELHVHHLNNKPNDNRPTNLELVTPRENNAARRAPLKEIIDLEKALNWANSIPKAVKKRKSKKQSAPVDNELAREAALAALYPNGKPKVNSEDVLDSYYNVPENVSWTGRRKGAGGCYHEATDGNWYYVKPDG